MSVFLFFFILEFTLLCLSFGFSNNDLSPWGYYSLALVRDGLFWGWGWAINSCTRKIKEKSQGHQISRENKDNNRGWKFAKEKSKKCNSSRETLLNPPQILINGRSLRFYLLFLLSFFTTLISPCLMVWNFVWGIPFLSSVSLNFFGGSR